MKELQIIYKNISELNPYENNPRFNDEAVEYVANSIKEFGFKNPIILDNNNVIICGHTRYKAAKKLKMNTVPCIVCSDLTPEQIKAFLRKAATRHYAFNYKNIAEYYAHAPAEIQELMEESALVIIDYNNAIRNGYVQLSEDLKSLVESEEENA